MRGSNDLARPLRSGLSVRTRITAVVALLVFLILVTSGALLYVVESSRVTEHAHDAAEQEIAEFRKLQQEGRDPATAEPFASADDLLSVFLQRNVSGEAEVLVAWLGDRARYVSAGPNRSLATDPAFEDAVRRLVQTGSHETVNTAHGPVLITVQPVQESNGSSGALVIATLLDDAKEDLRELMRTFAIIGALTMLVAVALAAAVAGRLLAPIRSLNTTARRITDSDLSARIEITGNDDLSDLTRTFNEMLDRLETAFEEQRAFLDDAGHELRTPLTVIRGHLELIDAADPDDVRQTLDLVVDEVDRMARLVGELMLLAKSRRPDFLRLSSVDVADLTRAALQKVTALGEREWRLDEAAEVTAVLDEQRMTQALMALAHNAYKHTQPGDVVAVGSAVEGRFLHLWVHDAGPGIAPDDRTRVVERFGRAASGDEEGFGLGLSIVNAIAVAHGGELTLQDGNGDTGRGALPGLRATVIIPLTREAPWHTS